MAFFPFFFPLDILGVVILFKLLYHMFVLLVTIKGGVFFFFLVFPFPFSFSFSFSFRFPFLLAG